MGTASDRDVPTTDAREWKTGTVSNGGVDLHYYRTGDRSGRPLVLAHGLFDSGECVAPLGAAFADQYDVVTWDARGHGRSDAPEEGYDVDTRVSDLASVLDGLDLTRPVLYGHSFGGNTVASFAATQPDRPAGVVLEDPAGMLDRVSDRDDHDVAREQRSEIHRWHEQSREALVAAFDEGHEPWYDALVRARRQVSTNITAITASGYRPPEENFPKITAPTLVLRADVAETERERDRRRVDRLADGQIAWVTGAGHCVRRDAYGAVVDHVSSFLGRIDSETGF